MRISTSKVKKDGSKPRRVKITKARKTKKAEPLGDIHEMVEKKAYEIFESRGHQHGHDIDHWVEAEKFVKTGK